MKLKICEIFKSIQGESSFAGLPCVFIRLSGCNLRCRYCDTSYAWTEGYDLPMSDIIDRILEFGCNLVLLTGGEPLVQSHTRYLLQRLVSLELKTLVETNGSVDVSNLSEEVVRIMDVKCPGSGESNSFYWNNLKDLRPHDEVKFVITDRNDYEWSRNFVDKQLNEFAGQILFSPAFGAIRPEILVKWILDDNLRVRFQLQLHKAIWGPTKRGV